MGQLTNLYVSQSFQGLLKMTDSTNGLTSTLQTVQTGDGDNSPLQMSLTEVNISGSFLINNVPFTGGTVGSSGTSGTSGVAGSSGTSGTSGLAGSSGTSGTSGVSGTSGTSGVNGSSGTSGTSGTSGGTGSSGTSGTSGVAGSSGTSGTSGDSGSSGTSGTAGTSGTSGDSLFALTGSVWNTTNNVGITGSLNVRSGSLSIVSNNTTVNTDLYLTSSQAGQVNIIKGWSDNPLTGGAGATQANYTGSLRITGSNNTVSLPQIRATGIGGGADQQGYISGSDNTIASNGSGIFLNTGSLLFPKTQNNNIGANGYILMNFTTSSLAGGHPIILNNTLSGGGLTINSNSGSVQASAGNIVNNGSVTSTQNFVTNTRPSISSNIVNGAAVTLNHISSSINYSSNFTNSPVTINNHLSSSNITNNVVGINNNTFLGGAGATGHNIYVSGSQSSNVVRSFNSNLIGGNNNIISSSFVSSSNSNLVSTIVYGNNLAVSASHTSATFGGSAFFGRFNDTGSLSLSQDIVFAVGTGTGTSNRRTGLSIDSGSNTIISGSLTTIGTSIISSSNVNTSDRTFVIHSGSMRMYNESGSIRIADGTNQAQLFFNPARKIGFFLGQSNMDQTDTQFGITSGSTDNYTIGGNFNNFRTGSNNLMLGSATISIRSGSNNVILAKASSFTTGSNNLILGSLQGIDEAQDYFNVQLPSTSQPIMFKSGSAPLTITGSLDVTGDLTIASGSGTNDLFMYGHKMFNGAQYSSLQTQSGSSNVSQSITYDTTGPEFGVSLVSGTRLTVANAGTYNIQFSAQLLADTGADDVHIWFKKNGTNIAGSASQLLIANNAENIMTINILDTAAASDYYEVCWQSLNGDAVLLSQASSGNIPSVPSIITTVTQVR